MDRVAAKYRRRELHDVRTLSPRPLDLRLSRQNCSLALDYNGGTRAVCRAPPEYDPRAESITGMESAASAAPGDAVHSNVMKSSNYIRAEVHLFGTDEGGRNGPTPPCQFGCLAEIEGEFFDCRLQLEDIGSLAPGTTAAVPIRFLRSDLVLPLLKVGAQFKLWEGRYVGTATVLEVQIRPAGP